MLFMKFQLPGIPVTDNIRRPENGELPNNAAIPMPPRTIEMPNKPLLPQELEAAMLLSTGNIPQNHPIQNHLPVDPHLSRFDPIPEMIVHNSTSVPLYRRQSSQTGEPQPQPPPPPQVFPLNNRSMLNGDDVNVERIVNNFNVIQLNSKVWETDKIQPELKILNRDMRLNVQDIDYNVSKNSIQTSSNKLSRNDVQGFANYPRSMFQPPPRHISAGAMRIPPEHPYINDFHLNGREQDIDESITNRQNNIETTYASVLRAQPVKNQTMAEEKIGDPFGILKDLANSSSSRGSNGLYQYFS